MPRVKTLITRTTTRGLASMRHESHIRKRPEIKGLLDGIYRHDSLCSPLSKVFSVFFSPNAP